MNISPINATSFKALIVRGKNGESDRVYQDISQLPNAQVDYATGMPITRTTHVVYNTETGKESIIYPSFDLEKMKETGHGKDIMLLPGYYSTLCGIEGYRPEQLQ